MNLLPGGEAFALYNTEKNDYLIYDSQKMIALRGSGGTSGGQTHDYTVWLTAKPPVMGYVPFAGTFGGGVNFNAVLTQVANTPNGPPLFFIKRGHSSDECGDPNAVIPLAGGTALNPEQMTMLYGSATPSLQTQISFLVCAATNASTVALNLKYRDL